MRFRRLKVTGWRQFKLVDVEFHPRLTVLTGANGAGKTTLLGLLGQHFGWPARLVSTPRASGPERSPALSYFSDLWDAELARMADLFAQFGTVIWPPPEGENPSPGQVLFLAQNLTQHFPNLPPERIQALVDAFLTWSRNGRYDPIGPRAATASNAYRSVGEIEYGDGSRGAIQVQPAVQSVYEARGVNLKEVKGFHIPSHRPHYAYTAVGSIPTVPRRRAELFGTHSQVGRSRWLGENHHGPTPNFFIKEALIGLAVHGHGNAAIEPDADSLAVFDGFEGVLRRVLPPAVGFERLTIRLPEVVLVTRSGEFSLDAVSGGMASIIDLAWQLFTFAPPGEEFAVTFDEPENHLHPELQRSLLPGLLEAFPAVQFVVASHNPFIISSVPDSHVYALRYDPTHRVVSHFLDTVNRAGTANEILRDVLGLPVTLPVWVEDKLDDIVAEFEREPVTSDSLRRLRERLTEVGLGQYVPETVARYAAGKRPA